jgi:hypothetical protein
MEDGKASCHVRENGRRKAGSEHRRYDQTQIPGMLNVVSKTEIDDHRKQRTRREGPQKMSVNRHKIKRRRTDD